jgi:hypothetical protein
MSDVNSGVLTQHKNNILNEYQALISNSHKNNLHGEKSPNMFIPNFGTMLCIEEN